MNYEKKCQWAIVTPKFFVPVTYILLTFSLTSTFSLVWMVMVVNDEPYLLYHSKNRPENCQPIIHLSTKCIIGCFMFFNCFQIRQYFGESFFIEMANNVQKLCRHITWRCDFCGIAALHVWQCFMPLTRLKQKHLLLVESVLSIEFWYPGTRAPGRRSVAPPEKSNLDTLATCLIAYGYYGTL